MRLNYTAELPKGKGFRLCKLQAVITEFVNSGKPFAKVEIGSEEYKSTGSAYSALRNSVKSCGMTASVTVKTIGGAVWIFNVPLMEKEGIKI